MHLNPNKNCFLKHFFRRSKNVVSFVWHKNTFFSHVYWSCSLYRTNTVKPRIRRMKAFLKIYITTREYLRLEITGNNYSAFSFAFLHVIANATMCFISLKTDQRILFPIGLFIFSSETNVVKLFCWLRQKSKEKRNPMCCT